MSNCIALPSSGSPPAGDQDDDAACLDLETSLSRMAIIRECAVRRRSTREGALYVAYVAPIAPFERFSRRKAESHLQQHAPKLTLPDAYALLTALPRTDDGTIDEAALDALPVIDDTTAEQAEAVVLAAPGVQSAVVFATVTSPRVPPLHSTSLLGRDPGATPHRGAPEHASAAAAASPANHDPSESPRAETLAPALSIGPALAWTDDSPRTLPQVLAAAARQYTDARITYLGTDGVREQSFAELFAEAERIGAGLLERGLARGQHVMLQLSDPADVLPAFWGCLLVGMIPAITAVPPGYDVQTNDLDRLGQIFLLLGRPPVLTTRALRGQMAPFAEKSALGSEQLLAIEELRLAFGPCPPCDPPAGGVAFVTLTSGSTGSPKAIRLSHENILDRAKGTNTLNGHDEDDRILNWLPFDHIGSISDWHLRCVLLGCRMVYCSREYVLGEPLNWMRLVERFRITHSWAPNFAYALVSDAVSRTGEGFDLGSMKALLTAGEAVSSSTVHDFLRRLAPHGLRPTAMRPAFGMAELGSGVTYYQPTSDAPVRIRHVDRRTLGGALRTVAPDDRDAVGFASLGPVIPGASMRIVDEQDQVLAEETIGRLQIAGGPVCLGYHENPLANAAVFVGGGWFDTGDRGFLSNGELYLTGRDKETLVVNGANYSSGEIESAVDGVDGVRVSFTAACAVRPAGSSSEKLVVFFSTPTGPGPALVDLLKRVQNGVLQKTGVMPDYLVPVEPDVIPKTAIGKIQRKPLVRRFEAGEFDDIVCQVDLWLENERTLPDWFLAPGWRPKAMARAALLVRGRRCLVLRDHHGLADEVARELEARGVAVVAANETSIGAASALRGGAPTDFVDLTGYGPLATTTSSPVAASRLVELIARIESFAQGALTERGATPPSNDADASASLLVVASHAQAVSPDEAVDPQRFMVPPVLRAVGQEQARVRCRHLDLTFGADVAGLRRHARRIADEVTADDDDDDEVAYRGERRLIPCLQRVEWPPARRVKGLEKGALYLVTGGLGGVGSALARHLLEQHGAKLLLVGRGHARDGRAATLRRLETLGTVEYRALDVTRTADLAAAVHEAELRAKAPLRGVFHLAGVYHEMAASRESAATFAEVLSSKLEATVAVHALLDERPDAFVLGFSSVAAVFSGSSLAAYAASNRCLDALAHEARRRGLRSYTMNWAIWKDLGTDQASGGDAPLDLLRARGFYGMPPSKGMLSLEAALERGPGQLVIGIDPGHPGIEPLVHSPPRPLLSLRGGFTSRGPAAPPASVRDRFGHEIPFGLTRLTDAPVGPDGRLDRGAVLARWMGDGRRERTPPETPLEKELAALWQAVLGLEAVGVDESFFDLGGTSLLSIRLFVAIQRRVGPSLPPATLFRAGTIRSMAALIAKEHGVGAATEPTASTFSPLVPIQAGDGRAPFFCVHGAGGNVLNFRDIARRLGDGQTFYGLQAPGVDGSIPLETIEEMADLYLREVLRVQPQGPFRIGGYSAGGLVAYEMAQRLVALGHDVPVLVFFDTFAAGVRPERTSLEQHLHQLRVEGPRYFPRRARYAVARRIEALGESLRVRWQTTRGGPMPLELRDAHVRGALREAAGQYRPRTYPGSITMYRASQVGPWFVHAGPKLGWEGLAPDMTIVEVPGDHDSLVREPNVSVVTSHLRETLLRLGAEAPSALP